MAIKVLSRDEIEERYNDNLKHSEIGEQTFRALRKGCEIACMDDIPCVYRKQIEAALAKELPTCRFEKLTDLSELSSGKVYFAFKRN